MGIVRLCSRFFFSGKRANELSNSWSSMTNICDRICRMKLGEVRYLESLVVICGNRIIEDRGFDSKRSSFQWSLAFVKLIVIKWLISALNVIKNCCVSKIIFNLYSLSERFRIFNQTNDSFRFEDKEYF